MTKEMIARMMAWGAMMNDMFNEMGISEEDKEKLLEEIMDETFAEMGVEEA